MATELVDASKLDACCSAEANAIRAKTGSAAQIAYDWANSKGFADAIAAISGGGGDLGDYTWPSGSYTTNAITSNNGLFRFRSGITHLNAPNLTGIAQYCFADMANLESISLPSVTSYSNTYIFYNCPKLEGLVLSNTSIGSQAFQGHTFQSCTLFQYLDVYGPSGGNLISASDAFASCPNFDLLIIRRADRVCPLSGSNSLNGSKFASGGAGGTVYLPKALYDHLGDGGALDYKASANWGTIDSYGTITWAQIESSYYETHYADGTLI